jgi:hypothetical protein
VARAKFKGMAGFFIIESAHCIQALRLHGDNAEIDKVLSSGRAQAREVRLIGVINGSNQPVVARFFWHSGKEGL